MRLLSLIPLPGPVVELFAEAFDFVPFTPGDPLERLHTALPEALLCAPGGPKIDGALLDRLPGGLRAIATYSVGYDHIDLAACRARGLAVFNTPEVLTASVADAALLLILGAARRATEAIELIRSGGWSGWTPTQLVGTELAGKRLGIMGMGRVGRRIAARAAAFGMELAYSNRHRAAEEAGARFVADPRELFAQSDVFLLACPSTDETRRFVDRALLSQAPRNLILVNVGRGDLVDDEALIAALASRRITAAGLDVFDQEPNFDQRYLALPNVFMLPHIGSSTIEARLGMGRVLADGMNAWRRDGALSNRIA
ncbi:NAD(P)-dependent oxidoreductase [Sphingobium sp. HWE2-09]|uniref:NAD(P)-dependent oxidoreductase n=1 Tax=Sphingobium sp. HWE2-09 TaxID=3108390 RepID=UPI002DCA0DFF|nr:NAD(P)-dependent oxidoreductase [Sphingobium sp. HWE2-09]